MSIVITDLDFKYENTTIFEKLNLSLLPKNCYVLSGLNGCGKSTLLKIIAGKTISDYGKVKVLDEDPFRCTTLNAHIAYLSNDWGTRTVAYSGYNIPIQSAIQVKDMMVELRKKYSERSDELLDVLGINLEWSLNNISEGQRKRVQLYLGLVQPFKICLLDEITVNLDVLVKNRLMNYLKKESIENNACIIYVTHIFDGLDDWCSQLIYMKKTRQVSIVPMCDIENKNIYGYLLEKFEQEFDHTSVENGERTTDIISKNAGGYTNGVLINYLTITDKS